jgi:hypothetical protein
LLLEYPALELENITGIARRSFEHALEIVFGCGDGISCAGSGRAAGFLSGFT